jgi:hypothetical protein
MTAAIRRLGCLRVAINQAVLGGGNLAGGVARTLRSVANSRRKAAGAQRKWDFDL